MQSSEWVEVATVDAISSGTMKHVEVGSREILIANVNGKFHAINDRCAHTNARLSRGSLRGNIVTCPLHAAQFDVTTGRKLAEPTVGGHVPDMNKLPPSFLQMIEHSRKIIAEIKTYDQETYELSVNGKSIQLKLK